ncbi:type III leader peptidase family protein [Staphylococcus microti]|uniref:Type III leader peptidase family protein n=2 Tax=Staphylococcus microti TaxID=569857 RepID=A0A380GUN1_9STAP|nr:A24 family peptidase [Staphylococcus microti]PNZ81585.1 prepilin peptidase [Staphylococcus microti]SUM57420.1 type III leader peptidase family protein [Staphylococcus microti]
MIVIVFILGSAVMSFLMHIADVRQLCFRMLLERSKCSSCNHVLNWRDLMPIGSYIMLKGKCRYCQALIPRKLLIAEILGGLIAVIPFIYPLYIDTSVFYMITFLLLALSMIDIQYLIVPHRFLFVCLVTNFLLHMPFSITHSQIYVIALLIISSFCLYRVIGMGDFKLLLVLALFLPAPFMVFVIWLTFPIGVLLLPLLYYCRLLKLPYIPLVPAISLSFIVVSLSYPVIITIVGGFI